MAEPKKPERPGTKDLKQDEVIARLVPDPADPPHVIRLAGYLGKSARRGFWRLYLTLELSDYVEVAEDDIVHSQALASQEHPLGGTAVWIRSDATLQHVRTESRQAQAEFLQGDITGAFLANAKGSVGGGGAFVPMMTRKVFTLGCCVTYDCQSVAWCYSQMGRGVCNTTPEGCAME
jgi:hypothetical protein